MELGRGNFTSTFAKNCVGRACLLSRATTREGGEGEMKLSNALDKRGRNELEEKGREAARGHVNLQPLTK